MRLADMIAKVNDGLRVLTEEDDPLVRCAAFSLPVEPIKGTSQLLYRDKPQWLLKVEAFPRPPITRLGWNGVNSLPLIEEEAAKIDYPHDLAPVLDTNGKPTEEMAIPILYREAPCDLMDELYPRLMLYRADHNAVFWKQPAQLWRGFDEQSRVRFLRLAGIVGFMTL